MRNIGMIVGELMIWAVLFLVALNMKKKGKNFKIPAIVSIVVYAMASVGAFAEGNMEFAYTGIAGTVLSVATFLFLMFKKD